jgi:hypothetical protein
VELVIDGRLDLYFVPFGTEHDEWTLLCFGECF